MSKKLTAICFVLALIMQSCSTGNMFSHKRYGHLKWIDHDTKIETKENEHGSEQTSPYIKAAKNTVIEPKTVVIPAEENSVTMSNEENQNSQPFTISPSNTVIEDNNSIGNDAIIDESESVNKDEELSQKSSLQKIEGANELKETKEGSTGELLLMALLIALALILFFLIDGALGGILSLVLIIFLILVLLRYFGVF